MKSCWSNIAVVNKCSFSVLFPFYLSPPAYAAAPTFKFGYEVKEGNIELNAIVQVACGIPWSAPFPVTVSVGRVESPSQTPETTEAWVTSEVVRQADTLYFTIPATAKYEGKIVCWYKSTRTDTKNPYSALSNPITLVACMFHYVC